MATTIIDDGSSHVRYDIDWLQEITDEAWNKTLHGADKAGATLVCTFSGE